MKIIYNILVKKIIIIGLFMLSFTGFAQSFTVFLANGTNPTPTTLEVDVRITVNSPACGVRLASVAFGVNYDPNILNGGTPCTTINCGSWDYIPGTKSPVIAALNPTSDTNRAAPVGHLRCTMINLIATAAIAILPGTYTIGRYRFTNTVPYTLNSNASLWMQPTNTGGSTNTIVSFYPCGATTPLSAYTTTLPVGGVILPDTVTTPLSIPLNTVVCATTGSFTQTPVTCFGGSDGTATITMASATAAVPYPAAFSYTVDNGAPIAGTLVAGAFTVTGLTAGTHTIAYTSGTASCTTPITIANVIVGGPAGPLTNTTTATACGSYTWSVTGLTYTTSGPKTGTTVNGSGCTVNETLNLTINPLTTNGSITTSICAGGSYTWPLPDGTGLSYTTAQTNLTNTVVCNTATLNLTITPLTTNGNVTTSICAGGSYVWPLPLGTGATYTTAQTGLTNVVGCNTATLNLTITPVTTTGSITTSICAGASYTWPANGVTYTTAQTGVTVVTACNTATLNLTITPLTTTGSVTTSICAGASYTWPANGVTYTTAQTGVTVVTACNTATLNLTITPLTTVGSVTTSICAGASYTWPANGVTYTTAQTGVTFVTACNTATLNLTITPLTTTGSVTTSICAGASYTWPANGVTYTTAQSGVTVVTACNTATLNLTITPLTTNGNVTTSICAGGSYVWPLPTGTGLTYTTAQTGLTNVVGCNTATLNLTITPLTTNGNVTTSICAGASYTWPLPDGTGLSYTTAQTNLSNTVGCNTATLNLTITPLTTIGSVTTSICAGASYTWPLPNGTGLTYTTAQTNLTNVVGCNTATLNLTITPLTTNGNVTTSICAGGSYVWPLPLGTGATYTTAQTNLTNVVGCNTATLNLTITPLTTNGNVTTSICAGSSYTWPLPDGTGLSYTAAQTNLTNTVGCNTATLNLTITPLTTTGSVTTSICAGASYTWPANGVAYTTAQTGVTVVAGCNAATLNLTITPLTTNGNITTSICAGGSYVWPLPNGTGLTYTTAQTNLTNVVGCNTATLNLTITPLTTNGSVTTAICAGSSYVWPLPNGTGLTYTTAQTNLTNVVGCNTATLNLTINSNTSGTTNAVACSTSYTWAGPLGNGLTYTTNQAGVTFVSTNAAGCAHTQTLNLVFNSTSGTSNITACNSYTWAAPLGNGLTYTTNQTGITFVSTNAAGCPHTQTLNLTINSSTTGTTTATACDTYTWALPLGNGLTYTSSQTGIPNVTTNAAGCPHTQTLNLTINNSTSATTNVTACDNYTWAFPAGNGQTYTSSVSGVIKVSTNAAGCTHTQTLNVIINYNTSAVTNAVACSSYTWALPVGNGVTYTSSVFGVTKVTPNAGGCTHTQTLNLVINNPTTGTTNASACGSYTWAAPLGNGQTYTSSQTGITHISTNAAGCLHTQTLNLTINNSTTGTTNATACNTYTWALPLGNGQAYTTSQTGITHVSTNAAGCSHTQTLNLTINNSTSGTTNATACNSYTWALPLGNGVTYTSSVFGVTRITTNPAGCPHTQTLNLIISNSTTGTTNATACNSYTWALPLGNGQTYTTSQSGITNVTTNAAGCTHTQTLNLTINSSTTGTTNAVACTSYTWAAPLGNGVTYTSSVSGITHTSVNAAGCQHIQTLNLTINQNTTNGSVTITANNSYTWAANLVTYTTSGVYTYVTTNAGGCVNTATLNLTIIIVTGTTWYQDADGDGYGNPAVSVIAVVPPAGYVAIGTDCNDTVAAINPGAIEVCYDGIDNDCNGVIDNVGLPGGCIAIVTSLANPYCGITITNLSTTIRANYVVGAQGYRFRIRNLTTNVVLIKDRPVNYFTFSSLPGITLNATYKVDIALLINNVWQPFYGLPCNITVANPVSTIGVQCGTTLISMNQWVYATYYSSARGYRFRVTNTVTGGVQIKDQPLNRFNFNQLPSHTLGTVYFVEVALRNTDGTYLPYGPGCNITTPNVNREGDIDAINEFKVIPYPNPFVEDFKLNVRTSSENTIQIRVYDMLGKQIDNRNVEVSDIENLQIGANYPSGVYNVIVSQGENTQTLRVIKR